MPEEERRLPILSVDFNNIREGGMVGALERFNPGISLGDKVLAYDGDTPENPRCNTCEAIVTRIYQAPYGALGENLIDACLDYDTWK
jgi:hypothetical protein